MLQEKKYPNLAQSWGIVGIAITFTLVFYPLLSPLYKLIGKEITLFIYYLLSMGCTFVLAHFFRKKETANQTYDFSFGQPIIIILVSVTALALQLGILSPITSLIPMPDSVKAIVLELGNMNGFFAFITLVISAPILEELIFRGIMLDGLLKKYSPLKSIMISSLLFGLVHLNPWQFITAAGMGLFLGWVYYKTKKLSLCMIIHFVNNLLAFLSMQFSNMNDELNKTFVESYGGLTNAIMLIAGSSLTFLICLWILSRAFKKENKHTNKQDI